MALICPGCRTIYDKPMEVCPRDNLPLIPRNPASIELHPLADLDGASVTLLAGGMMVGEFRIEGPIGETEMGTTYSAVHPLIRKRVAIRVLHRRYAEDHRAVTRFVMEARAVNEIAHHNIVDILSIGELGDGRNYMVAELLDGLSLGELLRREQHLRPGILLPLFEQICDALDAAHAASFIHRDLKPQNIVVLRRPPRPFVKIQDFGLAKLRGQAERETDVATLVSTPVYMAPEHSHGVDVDGRADVYSLGIVLYEALTGALPYTAQELFRAFSSREPPAVRSPSEFVPLTPQLEQVVLTAMAWDPDHRQPTVRALWEGLREAIPRPEPWDIEMEPLASAEPQSKPLGQIRPPSPSSRSVLAPEAIVGDVGDDELGTDIVAQKVIHVRPPALGGPTTPVHDEDPTDIYCRSVETTPAPNESLGTPDTAELGGGDTEISPPPSAPDAAGGRRTMMGLRPLAVTRPVEAMVYAPLPNEPDEAPAPDAPASDEPYCSIEIIDARKSNSSQE